MRLFCLFVSVLMTLSNFAQDLVPYRKNQLWGYATTDRKIVIAPQFERAWFFGKNGLAKVKKNGKIWLIDQEGNFKTNVGYAEIFDFSEGLAAACRGGEFNAIQGEIVGGEWGYLNENAEEIIPFHYARAEDFKNGYAIVQQTDNWGNWGVIDKVGRIVLPFDYTTYSFDMRPFPGLRWHDVPGQLQADISATGDKWKIIDLKGKQIAAAKTGKHGLYKEETDREYEAKRKEESQLTQELLRNNKILQTNQGAITTAGTIWVIEKGKLYGVHKRNSDNTVSAGVINEKKEVVLPFEFDQVSGEYAEGMIKARKKDKWAFYTNEGKQITEHKYYTVWPYENGYARVILNAFAYDPQFMGYVDKNGNEFFEADPKINIQRKKFRVVVTDEYENEIFFPEIRKEYTDAWYIDNQYVMLLHNGMHQVYDRQGKKLLEGKQVEPLKNGHALLTLGNITKVMDLKTGKVIIDSLRPAISCKPAEIGNKYYAFTDLRSGKTGVLDPSGNIALPFEYKKVEANWPYFIVINQQSQMGIVDTLNKMAKPFGPESIESLSTFLYSIQAPGKKTQEIYDLRTKTQSNYRLANIAKLGHFYLLTTADKKYGILQGPTNQVFAPVYTYQSSITYKNAAGYAHIIMQMKKADNNYDLINTHTGKIIASGVEDVGSGYLPILAYKTNGKYMIYDTDGKPLSNKTYEAVKYLGSDYYIGVRSNGKWGVMDRTEQAMIDFKYDNLSEYYNGYLVASSKDEYGVMDILEKTFIPFEYDYISSVGSYFEDTSKQDEITFVFLGEKEGKGALINNKNKLLTGFELGDMVENTFTEVFSINKNGKPALYNYNGKCVLEPYYDAIEPFDISDDQGRDMIQVRKGKKFGLFNYQGKMILPCEYDEISDSDEYYDQKYTYFALRKDGKTGFLCNNGTITIPVVYDKIESQEYDVMNVQLVKANGHAGLYKNFTEKLTDLEYDEIDINEEYMYAGFIPVRYNGKYGFLDDEGKLVATPQYNRFELEEISQGYVLRTEKAGKKGILSTAGKVIVEAMYDELELQYDFNETGFLVKKGKLFGLYDYQGNEILPCNYVKTEMYPDVEAEKYTETQTVMAFIDKNGKKTGVTSDFKTWEILPQE